MRIIISGGETEASPCTTITVKGVTFGVLRTIQPSSAFFFSLSPSNSVKKKKTLFPSLDHTTPLSPLPFSLSARPLLPSECSRLMHPPLFSLLFTLISKLACFFPPTKRVCSVFFQPWPLEQERIRQTAMDALYPPKERMHGQKKRF